MTQQPEQQKRGSKLILVLVTLLWLAFLVGILGYKPYMDSQADVQQVDKPNTHDTNTIKTKE